MILQRRKCGSAVELASLSIRFESMVENSPDRRIACKNCARQFESIRSSCSAAVFRKSLPLNRRGVERFQESGRECHHYLPTMTVGERVRVSVPIRATNRELAQVLLRAPSECGYNLFIYIYISVYQFACSSGANKFNKCPLLFNVSICLQMIEANNSAAFLFRSQG